MARQKQLDRRLDLRGGLALDLFFLLVVLVVVVVFGKKDRAQGPEAHQHDERPEERRGVLGVGVLGVFRRRGVDKGRDAADDGRRVEEAPEDGEVIAVRQHEPALGGPENCGPQSVQRAAEDHRALRRPVAIHQRRHRQGAEPEDPQPKAHPRAVAVHHVRRVQARTGEHRVQRRQRIRRQRRTQQKRRQTLEHVERREDQEEDYTQHHRLTHRRRPPPKT
mmetsp:Transcript_13244/g.43169  ORF Transcript_13244/g.43169 Transcript_13244/m.43169 type:complete len:221 (-) Transcript_13244:36-698(-)